MSVQYNTMTPGQLLFCWTEKLQPLDNGGEATLRHQERCDHSVTRCISNWLIFVFLAFRHQWMSCLSAPVYTPVMTATVKALVFFFEHTMPVIMLC